jgi:hypothetical protein
VRGIVSKVEEDESFNHHKTHLHANDATCESDANCSVKKLESEKVSEGSISQRTKLKRKCWKVWREKHKMVVGNICREVLQEGGETCYSRV